SRDLSVPSKPVPWLRHLLKVVIPAMLFSSKAYTQGNVRKIIHGTSQGPVDTSKKNVIMGDTTLERVIKGRVFDTKGNPIRGASVVLAGKEMGTWTDKDGSFTLKAFPADKDVLLDVSSFGYEARLFSYPANETDMDAMITLQTYEVLIMGLIAVEKVPASGTGEKKADISKCVTADEGTFRVYPNPVLSGTSINIELIGLTKEDYYEFRLISFNGKTIFEIKIWIDKGARVMNISIPSTAPGAYFAVLRNRKFKKEYSQQILVTK
ncbi:MAG: carboxypeptidase-like regulatory domain-containing protein, partial [Chitinophagaceae bacterium]|nr:carboxypeptidase-like regulatory domain-containing protein [Chitinophagaceae bacterium]